jgi:hypothetical protein
VWEWADIATARVALVVGVINVLGCVGIAASPSRVTSIRYSHLLAAQVVLAGIAVACALVVLRSGAWLPTRARAEQPDTVIVLASRSLR